MNWKYKSALVINIDDFVASYVVEQLVHAGRKVNVFNSGGSWLDIGRHDDYDTAVQKFAEHRSEFLPV